MRILVFPAGPGGDADAGPGELLLVAPEGEAVDIDDALLRAAAEIGVGREREADADAPPLAGADLGEEAVDVERHTGGRVAGEDALEMLPRQPVLALEEEGAGEFQPDPDQGGVGDQHLAERGDGPV